MGETTPTADDCTGSDGGAARLRRILLGPSLQTHAHSTYANSLQVKSFSCTIHPQPLDGLVDQSGYHGMRRCQIKVQFESGAKTKFLEGKNFVSDGHLCDRFCLAQPKIENL